ncbi:MAG TPA: hypothetical protein VFY84_00100 [Jiangellales bacterium]|nr:hypothetical protein [Jiangellales bacterium]
MPLLTNQRPRPPCPALADRLLARSGNDPAGTWLMTRGRALFMKTHTPSVIGFGGQVARWESLNNQNAYSIALTPGTWTEQARQRFQTPSSRRSVHTSGSLTATVTKFIRFTVSSGGLNRSVTVAAVLTQPMHIDDLKYLWDPYYSYGPWLSIGQVSRGGRFVDNPGDLETVEQLHPVRRRGGLEGVPDPRWTVGFVQNLAQYAEADVEGQLAFNQYHTVTFTSVNTTRLRVVLNSTSTSSVGLLEVKAFTI